MNDPAKLSADSATGLLISGGLDSSILLWRLLQNGRRVQPFYIRSELAWEPSELDAVQTLLDVSHSENLESLIVLDIPLPDLYGDHWSISGRNIPRAGSSDEAVYLPGRNVLLAIKPALWCATHGIGELAIAVLAGNPFADATDEFFNAFESVIRLAIGRNVKITRPFAKLTKTDVLKLGQLMPLGQTFSCISPKKGLHCGRCNKCEERRRAFAAIRLEDPTQYAS